MPGKDMRNRKTVCVIGAGIAGATVARDLSQAGIEVHLIEKEARIGGHVIEMGCKATDVCLRCNVCVANEVLRAVGKTPGIHIHTLSELRELKSGTNGSLYTVVVGHGPTFIERQKCIGCLACVQECPEKCISIGKLDVWPGVPVIDFSACRRALGKNCSVCEQACPVDAIDMGQDSSQTEVDVDAVVVATGYEPYDPKVNASYGYGKMVNIITGVEAERQLAADGKITRPSGGEQPKRIAFIQCVGSRSEEVHCRPEDTDYCSAVCCAYALRIARLIKHQNSNAEITVFYMDIQKFGKGFREFYNECKSEINFIRSRPYEIKQGQNGAVRVKYTPEQLGEHIESRVCEAEFDLVILSVGIRPREDATKLAEALLVPIDEQGFWGLKGASALPELQREGIYAIGACEWPKDIESCMAQAEAISSLIIGES